MPASVTITTLVMVAAGPTAHGMSYGLTGQFQHRFERLTNFALDGDGTMHEQPFRHTVQTRIGAKMSFSRTFWLSSTIQLLDGQILGRESPVAAGVRADPWRNVPLTDHLQLRESMLQVPVGLGLARIGRMPIHWGMGLVVHDGQTRDDPFDEPHGGDIVNGAWLDLTPLLTVSQTRLAHALHVGLGGDIVEQDELTRRSDGDLAWRLAGSVSWEEPWLTGGVYVMMRRLERANSDTAEHLFIDAACRYETRLADRFKLVIEGEAAMVAGSMKDSHSDGAETETQIAQYGGATRVTLDDTQLDTNFAVELGYASGDTDAQDSRDTAFRFDPARRVGMLLFDEVLARMSARHSQSALTTAGGAALRAVEPTNGTVTNAFYVAPRASLELCDGCFALQAGGVIAFATEPLVAQSELEDGTAALGPLGSRAKAGALGYEINAGATVALDLESVAHFSLGTQYGVFFAGEALGPADKTRELGVVHKWRLMADVSW